MLTECDSEWAVAERSDRPEQQVARRVEGQADDSEAAVQADYHFEKRFWPSLTEVE